jgi:hypothetical protein
MSSLTTCNFCNLRQIKARAKSDGKIVTVLQATVVGFDVMVHAPYEKVVPHEPGDGNPHWRAWMQAIGTECECR